jgi:vanillate O-demethylase ferredoxin subunit
VLLPDGRTDLRHYSLVGPAPVGGCWRIAVKREEPGRGGSAYMWSLKPGHRLEVSHPDTHFELSRDTANCLLIAGGIGITPIVGMALSLHERSAPFRMIYAGRSRAQMALLDELAPLAEKLAVFADDEGAPPDLAPEIAALEPDAEAYVCGPIGLMDAVRRAWSEAGRPIALLRFETFGSSGRYAPEPFTVRIPRLQREIRVPADSTMLAALESAGVELLADCRRGECGLCVVDVLDHDKPIDHRDVFFSDHEHADDRKMCTCVSRQVGGTVTIDTAWRPGG